MIRRNARNLILLSRSGVKKKNAEVFVEELKSMGARVEAPICDIANIEVLHQVFGSLVRDMPPIRGCVQASMVARVIDLPLPLSLQLMTLTAVRRMFCFKT